MRKTFFNFATKNYRKRIFFYVIIKQIREITANMRLYPFLFYGAFFVISIILVLALSNIPLQKYSIQPIMSFSEALPTLLQADHQTLVLFDLDETLLSSTEPLARVNCYPWWFYWLLRCRFPILLNTTRWEQYYSSMWHQAPRNVIEPWIIGIINTLQANNVPVLAFTNMSTGSYGVIKNFPQWRWEILHNLGLHFTQQFPDMTLRQVAPYRNNYPELYKGILCANEQNKGLVLEVFLATTHFRPKKIIFFDDLKRNLIYVARSCKKFSIPVHLYWYQGATCFRGQCSISQAYNSFVKHMAQKPWRTATQ